MTCEEIKNLPQGQVLLIRKNKNHHTMEEMKMENAKKITGEMLVGKICAEHPEAIPALQAVGMHCLGCPSSQMESLNDAAFVHGLDPQKVVDAVNAALAEN